MSAAKNSVVAADPSIVYVYTDGSARPNPGRGAYAYVVLIDGVTVDGRGVCVADDPLLHTHGSTLHTNNEMEWRAFIAGLEVGIARVRGAMPGARLVVRLDSELVVKQLRGIYRCTDTKLVPLYNEARRLMAAAEAIPQCSVRVEHVERSRNVLADALAQRAVKRARNVTLRMSIVDVVESQAAASSSKRART